MRAIAIAGLCLALGLQSGCATATSPEAMTIAPGGAPSPGAEVAHALSVGAINGGAATDVLALSSVDNAALKDSLRGSLRNLGYLAEDPAAARYVVSADIVDLDRPMVAMDPALLLAPIDLSVTVRIRYHLTPARGGAAVFQSVVATTGTATANDAITPAGRVRKAEEAAVRMNIASFLGRMNEGMR